MDQPPEPMETDYSEAVAEEEQDLRRRGDKAFLTEGAKYYVTHLCAHLPKNPYCTSRMRARVNQKQKRRRGHKKHTIDAQKFATLSLVITWFLMGYNQMVLMVRLWASY